MTPTMLGLTITQPWASLIAAGAKRVETRDWDTDYRGLLAITAAKGLSGLSALLPAGVRPHEDDLQTIANTSPFWDELRQIEGLTADGIVQAARLPRFAIVAVCNLADVVPVDVQVEKMRRWAARGETDADRVLRDLAVDRELVLGDYTAGRYAWRLAAVRPVVPALPMPAGAVRYYRKLWHVPNDVAATALGSPLAT